MIGIGVALAVGAALETALASGGLTDASREGAADAFNDDAPFPFFPDPFPRGGADNEVEDWLLPGNGSPLPAFSPSLVAAKVAYSESLSPTHERANQRPPAIPRISRWAVRQCLTFLPLLSRGRGGAKPVGIFGGG